MSDTWQAIILRDGAAVAGPLPCSDWDAASLVAEFFAGFGGTVSVGAAVVAARPEVEM